MSLEILIKFSTSSAQFMLVNIGLPSLAKLP